MSGSESPTSTPTAMPKRDVCPTCNRILTRQICKSNKNGNCGRTFVSCFHQHSSPSGNSKCEYFHWLSDLPVAAMDASSQSTSRSTSPSSSLSSNHGTPPSTFTIHLPAHSAISSLSQLPASMLCAQSGCKVTRVHPDCAWKKCWCHCVADSGCMVKTHTQWEAQVLSGSPEPPILDAEPAQDLFADPCHASQMTAVFTQHYAREQTIQEERHMVDAERMSNDV